ncbi:DNA/RNA non-specific endonuclease, partial [Acinetobacter portensis]
KLLIGNAQNNADLDAMGVKKVTNVGGVIANAAKNTDGTLTDHGKLNYSGELELKDIEDHNYNSSRGFNVSTSIGIAPKGTAEASTAPKGSTTIGVNSSGQETEQLTKATMGQGTVTNATDTTNRDINNTQEITRDQTTGMLDGSVTIDHRLLTEDGRKEIIQQQKDLPQNAEIVGKMTAAGVTSLGVATAALASGDQNLKQAYDTVMNPARTFDFIQKNPEAATVIEQFKNGNYDGILATKGSIQLLAQALGQDVEVLTTSITSFLGIKGAFDHQTNTVVLDVNNENRTTIVDTFGHEIAHGQGIKNETSADLIGKTVDWAFDSGIQHNQSTVDQYKNQLGDGKDEATQAQNKDILKKDNQTFIDNAKDHPDEIDESTSFAQDLDFATDLLGCAGGGLGASVACLGEKYEDYRKLDKVQTLAYQRGYQKAVDQMVDDVKNLPQNTLDALILLKEDPKAFGGAIIEALKELPAEYKDKAEKVAKAKFTARTQAEFEAAGKAELELKVEIGGLLLGGAGSVKVSAKVLDAVKKIKLKADFDPNLKVQTNGPSTAKKSKINTIEVKVENSKKGTKEYEILNNPPSNSHVKLNNGVEFKTNAYGYIEEIEFQPSLTKNPRDSRQTAVGKKGLPEDVGGHIQACSLGGTCDNFNLFPQNRNFNNSAYKTWENEIRTALKNGKKVEKITVKFDRSNAANIRPNSLVVEYNIDGVNLRKTFENKSSK